MTLTMLYILFGTTILIGLICFYLFYKIVTQKDEIANLIHDYKKEFEIEHKKLMRNLEYNFLGMLAEGKSQFKLISDELKEEIEIQTKELRETNYEVHNNIHKISDILKNEINQIKEIRRLNAILLKKNKQIERLKRHKNDTNNK